MTGTNDVAVVRKYVFRAVLGANEAVALLGVKPFYDSSCYVSHVDSLFLCCRCGTKPVGPGCSKTSSLHTAANPLGTSIQVETTHIRVSEFVAKC